MKSGGGGGGVKKSGGGGGRKNEGSGEGLTQGGGGGGVERGGGGGEVEGGGGGGGVGKGGNGGVVDRGGGRDGVERGGAAPATTAPAEGATNYPAPPATATFVSVYPSCAVCGSVSCPDDQRPLKSLAGFDDDTRMDEIMAVFQEELDCTRKTLTEETDGTVCSLVRLTNLLVKVLKEESATAEGCTRQVLAMRVRDTLEHHADSMAAGMTGDTERWAKSWAVLYGTVNKIIAELEGIGSAKNPVHQHEEPALHPEVGEGVGAGAAAGVGAGGDAVKEVEVGLGVGSEADVDAGSGAEVGVGGSGGGGADVRPAEASGEPRASESRGADHLSTSANGTTPPSAGDESSAPAEEVGEVTPAKEGEGASSHAAKDNGAIPANKGPKGPSNCRVVNCKVGEPSKLFQKQLVAKCNVFDLLSEADEVEREAETPATEEVELKAEAPAMEKVLITQTVKTVLRSMDLVMGYASSVGNNCAVHSAEMAKANKLCMDSTTALQANEIREGMCNKFRDELKKRSLESPESPITGEEWDLVRDLGELEPFKDELRSWRSKEGLEVPSTDADLNEWLARVRKDLDQTLAYLLLDKALEYTGRIGVMLRGVMFLRLAEWYKRSVLIFIPTRDDESGVVSVIGMIYRPRQEQEGAAPLVLVNVPLHGTIELVPNAKTKHELALNAVALYKGLDHLCPVVSGKGKGGSVERALLGAEVMALLDSMPETEEGEAGEGQAAGGKDTVSPIPDWGPFETLPLLDTSPGHIMDAAAFIKRCDAAIAGSKDAVESRRLQKARDIAAIWVERRFTMLANPYDHPSPVEDDMQTDEATPYAKALHAATLLVNAEQNDSSDPAITFHTMLVTAKLATVLRESESQLNYEHRAELDSITVKALAHSVGLQSRFEKACSQTGKAVEGANLADGYTVVAYGKKATTEEEKNLQRAVKAGEMNADVWRKENAFRESRGSAVNNAMWKQSNPARGNKPVRVNKSLPPGPSANKDHAAPVRDGGKVNPPPRNGK
jgi:hypothetical protein